MNMLRRLAKLAALLVLGAYLSGCVIVPLHGWGHGEWHGERGGYGDHGGYGDRH